MAFCFCFNAEVAVLERNSLLFSVSLQIMAGKNVSYLHKCVSALCDTFLILIWGEIVI